MCMFSMTVEAVSTTKIFARASTDEKQFLVYSMSYAAAGDVAMILPLPTPVAPAEDAVRFIDLSDYPDFFKDLYQPFRTRSLGGDPASATLAVHQVGSFEASFVPRLQDFSRLDDRFRLDDGIWQQLPLYQDYAFAVFKLKAGRQDVHPMAFEFPRRNASELFFPTVHVHAEHVEQRARFDHALYCQAPSQHWQTSRIPANLHVDITRAAGIINPLLPIQMHTMFGQFENVDVILS